MIDVTKKEIYRLSDPLSFSQRTQPALAKNPAYFKPNIQPVRTPYLPQGIPFVVQATTSALPLDVTSLTMATTIATTTKVRTTKSNNSSSNSCDFGLTSA